MCDLHHVRKLSNTVRGVHALFHVDVLDAEEEVSNSRALFVCLSSFKNVADPERFVVQRNANSKFFFDWSFVMTISLRGTDVLRSVWHVMRESLVVGRIPKIAKIG